MHQAYEVSNKTWIFCTYSCQMKLFPVHHSSCKLVFYFLSFDLDRLINRKTEVTPVTRLHWQNFIKKFLWEKVVKFLSKWLKRRPISAFNTLCMQGLKWLRSLKILPTRPRERSGRLVISLPGQWSLSSPISRKGPEVRGKRKTGPFRIIHNKYF